MGVAVLIEGESGTGKSASLRNFKPEEISIINVDSKPFPFKNGKDFKKVLCTDNAEKIIAAMKRSTSKVIVIDDAQYIMANAYMRKANVKGYDKYVEIGVDFFNIVEAVKELPDDVIVYFFMHTEETNGGIIKAKTIGKMLDTTITLEGKFTIVLRTLVKDGNYYFTTQNCGYDTVKTPMGMFEENEIPNDTKYVDTKIRDYYEM